jgi:hypothetical protein
MPADVVLLGGEVYFADMQPGHGISSVGIEDVLPPDEQRKRDSVRDQIF